MEKYIEKNKPGTFTPYHEAAENLKRKLSILERLVPSAQDRAQLAMAIRVKNARCNNPEPWWSGRYLFCTCRQPLLHWTRLYLPWTPWWRMRVPRS